MGYLYRPKLKSGKPGRIWWIKYYVNAAPVRESTGAEKESGAGRFLKAREGRVAMGQPILRRADRIRSVFERYNIVSEADLREAGRKLTGTFSGTSHADHEAPQLMPLGVEESVRLYHFVSTKHGKGEGREGGFDSYPVECAGRVCPESLVLAAATGS